MSSSALRLEDMFEAAGPARTAAAAHAVSDLIDRVAQDHPRHAAIDFLGRLWTYGEVGAAVDHAAAGLQALGVRPGDRIGLCLPNTPYFVIAYFAALKIGAVVVNYNPLYVARELAHQIRDSGTSVMFVIDIPLIHDKVAAVAEETGLRKIVLCSLADALTPVKGFLFKQLKRKQRVAACPADGRHLTFDQLIDGKGTPAAASVGGDDLAVIQYTGGTTGVPKGAMLTHRNIVANCAQVVGHDPQPHYGSERVLGVLPLFHVFAMQVVMNYAVATAAEMILLPRYDLKATMKALLRRHPTVFPAVPTIYAAIAALAQKRKRDLSFVRLCISGGAPLPVETGETFRAVTGAHLVEGYGLTEAAPVVSCNPVDGSGKHGSVGRPLTGTLIEIRDPATHEPVTIGAKGEVIVRGDQVMAGYWQRPEDTAAILQDGGLRTGDIGYLDADGYLFIVDRIKDVILCGGYNVYPRVIEDALYQHPAVAEVIVIGVKDSYRGEAPKAFVVVREGETATPQELQTFLDGYVSKIERPKAIELRASLPKTAVGKLSRKELVAEEKARIEGGAPC